MKRKSLVPAIAMLLMMAFAAVTVSAVTKKSTIRVEGMKCKMCTGSVEKALKATPGVEKVEVSLERKEAVVEYDDEKVTEAKLREVINATGFKAVEEQADPK
jgi:mercuric ion binding protein